MRNQHPTQNSIHRYLLAFSLLLAVAIDCFMCPVLFERTILSQSLWADETLAEGEKDLSAGEQEALAKFQKAYRLEKDQNVKWIKAPFLAGRLIDREHRWKNQWMNADYQKPRPGRAGLIPYCYVYFERNGVLAPPHHFCSGSDQVQPANQTVDIIAVIEMVTNIHEPNLNGRNIFSNEHIAGDWVVREGTPTDELVTGLEQILKRDCGLPIQLEYEEKNEDVVIVRHGSEPFVPKLDSPVKIYATLFRPNKGSIQRGTFKEFLNTIGQSIQPSMRVISEIDSPPKEPIAWHVSLPDRFDDGDVNSVLDHLGEQTGLKFKLETLKTKKINITRSE